MRKYYLYNGSRQYGPFSFAELKHQHLLRDTPVWYEGLNEWVTAGSVEALQELLPPASPPPFIVSNNHHETTVSPFASSPTPKTNARLVNRILLVAGILVFLVLAMIVVMTWLH